MKKVKFVTIDSAILLLFQYGWIKVGFGIVIIPMRTAAISGDQFFPAWGTLVRIEFTREKIRCSPHSAA